mgnify:CR=1 FL=1|jgi:hypothetical protein
MLILKLLKKENENLRGALSVLLNRGLGRGSSIGFRIGKRHFTITRD